MLQQSLKTHFEPENILWTCYWTRAKDVSDCQQTTPLQSKDQTLHLISSSRIRKGRAYWKINHSLNVAGRNLSLTNNCFWGNWILRISPVCSEALYLTKTYRRNLGYISSRIFPTGYGGAAMHHYNMGTVLEHTVYQLIPPVFHTSSLTKGIFHETLYIF
jgi:hypothetical protein